MPAFRTLTLCAALMLTALAPLSAARSQTLIEWGTVPGWDIKIDPTLGNGCLIQGEFEDGSVVRVGFDMTQDNGYLTAFNGNWGDIVEGQAYPVRFELDGQPYDGEAKGLYLNGVPGADIAFDNPDFIFDIAARQTMVLFHEGSQVMAIDLTGTAVALAEAVKCQEQQG